MKKYIIVFTSFLISLLSIVLILNIYINKRIEERIIPYNNTKFIYDIDFIPFIKNNDYNENLLREDLNAYLKDNQYFLVNCTNQENFIDIDFHVYELNDYLINTNIITFINDTSKVEDKTLMDDNNKIKVYVKEKSKYKIGDTIDIKTKTSVYNAVVCGKVKVNGLLPLVDAEYENLSSYYNKTEFIFTPNLNLEIPSKINYLGILNYQKIKIDGIPNLSNLIQKIIFKYGDLNNKEIVSKSILKNKDSYFETDYNDLLKQIKLLLYIVICLFVIITILIIKKHYLINKRYTPLIYLLLIIMLFLCIYGTCNALKIPLKYLNYESIQNKNISYEAKASNNIYEISLKEDEESKLKDELDKLNIPYKIYEKYFIKVSHTELTSRNYQMPHATCESYYSYLKEYGFYKLIEGKDLDDTKYTKDDTIPILVNKGGNLVLGNEIYIYYNSSDYFKAKVIGIIDYYKINTNHEDYNLIIYPNVFLNDEYNESLSNKELIIEFIGDVNNEQKEKILKISSKIECRYNLNKEYYPISFFKTIIILYILFTVLYSACIAFVLVMKVKVKHDYNKKLNEEI